MTKRILNADKPVVEKSIKQIPIVLAEELPKPLKKKEEAPKTLLWYRVAIFKKPAGEYYALIANKDMHVAYFQTSPDFVRWEPAVEVEV